MTLGRVTSAVLVVAVSIAFLWSGAPIVKAESIGIAPTSFDLQGVARGQEYKRTITVWHDSEEERNFTFIVSGSISEWITFFDNETGETIETLSIPHKGTRSQGSAGVSFVVPEDAANGFYTGQIRISAVATDPSGGASSATVGAVMNTFADVTGDQVLVGTLRDASAISIETGVPLRFDLRISNDGNVEISPQFEISILDDELEEVEVLVENVDPIGPGEIAGRSIEIDSSRLLVGDYTAVISGNFRDLRLGDARVNFSVLERGTLSRSGVIESISLANEPTVGQTARLIVKFNNTGQIEANAIFEGQVFFDGELVDVITSLPKLVLAGQEDQLELFFDVEREGEYVISGKVNFDGKESPAVEFVYSPGIDQPIGETNNPVDEAPDEGGISGIVLMLLVVIAAVAVGSAIYLAHWRGWRIPIRRSSPSSGT